MPIVKHIHDEDFELMVWRIEEDKAFFSQELSLNREESEEYLLIQAENRKLEWLAARYLQRRLVNDSLVKDEFGKPRLRIHDGFVSISHCAGYAAAAYSKLNPTGIDIEIVHPRILRIAAKFASEDERSFVSKNQEIEHLICMWCLKESVYKWYGKKNLSFKNHIKIRPFQMLDEQAQVNFLYENHRAELNAKFFKLENLVVAYL